MTICLSTPLQHLGIRRQLNLQPLQSASLHCRRQVTVRAEDPSKVVREFSEETGKTLEGAKDYIQQGRPKDNVSPEMKKRMRDEYVGFGGSPNTPLKTNYFVVISGIIATLAIISKVAGYI